MCKDAKESTWRFISSSEVRKHNSPSNAWCTVHDKVIDITDFAKRHPGGDIILLSAGKDATVLFHTYHPRGVPSAILDKLQIGEIKEKISYYDWNSEFYNTLCQRVTDRLRKLNRPLRGGYEIWLKSTIILISFWFSLFKMYTSEFRVAVGWTILMGIFAHFVGTCIQHDGNHGAFSTSSWLNMFAGWTMDMIGANAFTWRLQHMLGHHPYTNLVNESDENVKTNNGNVPIEDMDQESDPDVFSSFPLVRMHPVHEPKWFHRYQHLYAPLLFALMTLAKVFQQDIEVAMSQRLYHIDAKCIYGSSRNVIRFWGMKAVSMVYMLGLPIYFHGIKNGFLLFFIGHMVCGEVLATMFIVNHVIEGVSFAQKNSKVSQPMTCQGNTPMLETMKSAQNEHKGKVPLNDWAAVQCQTSVNWSPGSWFWNHFSGGLSHQIEHHLFPSICHTNYVHIQGVVESTCKEYGVPYQAERNLFTAYGKMLKHLKQMGRP
jgi:acyl-lipid (8-3)-desaturase